MCIMASKSHQLKMITAGYKIYNLQVMLVLTYSVVTKHNVFTEIAEHITHTSLIILVQFCTNIWLLQRISYNFKGNAVVENNILKHFLYLNVNSLK